MNYKLFMKFFIIFFIVFFIILLIISNYYVIDNRKNKNTLRLVQYNTDFLYSKSIIINCPGNDCTWKNNEEQNKHTNTILNIIKKLDPDIINFCEINSNDILKLLINKLNDYSYKSYVSISYPNYIDQSVGIMTRINPISFSRTNKKYYYPIKDSKCNYYNKNKTIINLQKHYISKFCINNINILIIGIHLKSIPNKPYACSIREAQAMIIQEIIVENYKNYEIIVIGDFNDYDNEVKDYINHIPNSKVLNIIKGNTGNNPINYKLYNTNELIAHKNRKTAILSDNTFSMIDYILISKNLKKYIKDVFIYTDYYGNIGENYNSDHYPLVIDFDFTIRN
jgi:exonuclease III